MRPSNFAAPGLPSRMNGVRLRKLELGIVRAYARAERTRKR